jgi:phosphoglycerol transferase
MKADWARDRGWWKIPGEYGLVLGLTLVAVCFALELWRADLGTPFYYAGDTPGVLALVKGVLENGWYLVNPSRGAPGALRFYDYPMAESTHLAIIKLLGGFVRDAAAVMNLYYLLTFLLCAASAFFVLRQLRISFGPALAAGVLFALAPYHFMRNEAHFFLSGYFLVPLAVWLALHLLADPAAAEDQSGKPGMGIWRFLTLGAGICLLIGGAGVYYAFFSCYLWLLAGVFGWWRWRSRRALLLGLTWISLTSLVFFLNILPSLLFWMQAGPNPNVALRAAAESEVYGFKLTQLLFPAADHRLAGLAEFTRGYLAQTQLNNENVSAALGLAGTVGFVGVLIALGLPAWRDTLLGRLGILNLGALLLGVIGGLGVVFAFLVSPPLRAWNRISIFLLFVALAGLAALLERFLNLLRSRRERLLALALILLVGIWDQTSPAYVPAYEELRLAWDAERRFVKMIEHALPAQAMIFQYPQHAFPEPGKLGSLDQYEMAEPYLHSRNLRWSYGAIKGRDDRFHRQFQWRSMDYVLDTIALAGFDGLYINRKGLPDYGTNGLRAVGALLGTNCAPLICREHVFFDIRGYAAETRSRFSGAALDQAVWNALHPVELEFGGGFYPQERNATTTWAWCGYRPGEISVVNPGDKPRNGDLILTLALLNPAPGAVELKGLLDERVEIAQGSTVYSNRCLLQPGTNSLFLSSQSPRLRLAEDDRELIFRVINPVFISR